MLIHLIVSIGQSYEWPIVRGKVDKPREFGAKVGVTLTGEGVARVDHLRWDFLHEVDELQSRVEAYRKYNDTYPEVFLRGTISAIKIIVDT